jgi:hypothetical protein
MMSKLKAPFTTVTTGTQNINAVSIIEWLLSGFIKTRGHVKNASISTAFDMRYNRRRESQQIITSKLQHWHG